MTTSVRDFMVPAFAHAGETIGFKGKGVNEIGFVEQVDNHAEDVVIKPGDELGVH